MATVTIKILRTFEANGTLETGTRTKSWKQEFNKGQELEVDILEMDSSNTSFIAEVRDGVWIGNVKSFDIQIVTEY